MNILSAIFQHKDITMPIVRVTWLEKVKTLQRIGQGKFSHYSFSTTAVAQ